MDEIRYFNDSCFCFKEIETECILKENLFVCQNGYNISIGYDDKRFYLIEFFKNVCSKKCYGIGVMCQNCMDTKNNIYFIEYMNLCILFFDNVVEIYKVLDEKLNKELEYRTSTNIYDIKFILNKLVIIHEVGIVVVNLLTNAIIRKIDTDIIKDFDVYNNGVYIEDIDGEKCIFEF